MAFPLCDSVSSVVKGFGFALWSAKVKILNHRGHRVTQRKATGFSSFINFSNCVDSFFFLNRELRPFASAFARF